MTFKLPWAGRAVAVTATLLCALGTPSPASAAPDPTADEACAGFVYLDHGKLTIDEKPYQLKGVNFAMAISAKERPGGVDPPYEYFLAPPAGTRPDNNAVCGSPADLSCCDDATSCADSLQTDIDALKVADFNSVRLLFHIEWDNHHPRHRIFRVNEGQYASAHYLYLDDPSDREIALEMLEQQVNWLGSYGVRSILLAGNFDHGDALSKPVNLEWLEHVAARFVNNPYLLAYDPQNEPLFQDEHQGSDPKLRANELSYGWFDALTSNDRRHLITVGILGAGSVFSYDPQIVWDHFTSYHIYPSMPWTSGPVPGGHPVENDIFYAAQNECGDPCPFAGEFDTANCLVSKGPVGSTGSVASGEFRYTPVGGANPCPVGQMSANGCVAGRWLPYRDQPFTLAKTVYYVTAQNGTCPPGGQWDGANCVMFESPPGATPFIWTSPSGQTAYYYDWLSGPEHCRAPAVDDTAHCWVGDVPAGWSPFLLQQPLFYVAAATCGPKKPIHIGETGFTVVPYPGGSKDFWPPPNGTVVPQGLYDMQSRCEEAANGPTVDTIAVGGTVYEAENSVTGGTAQVVSCPGCSGGQGVDVLSGGKITIVPAATNACEKVTFTYRSTHPTSLRISVNGKPPVWLRLPASPGGATWSEKRDFSIGTIDSVTLSATEQVDGDFDDQVEYVQGGSGWPGVFPYSNACGFQGLHWWEYGSEARYGATCADYGLNAYWYQVESRNELYPDELLYRPVMASLRDQVDYLSPAGPCEKPAGFNLPLHSQVSDTPRYTYRGMVKYGKIGLPYVPVQAWFHECTPSWSGAVITTFTDETGAYVLSSEHPIANVRASHFGFDIEFVDTTALTPSANVQVPDIHLQPIPNLVVDHASLHVPSTPGRACWQSGSWVVQ